ncbi:MAG TPA: hypothetical protein VLA82_02605 [Actinomycetota bacterium]|nr:hypothetical protein [Actinomycetota bacterium]
MTSPDASVGRVAAAFSRAIVRGRWVVLVVWVMGAIVALLNMPPPVPAGGAGLRGLVPEDSRAVEAEIRDLEAFGFPVLSRTIVVQHDPEGL